MLKIVSGIKIWIRSCAVWWTSWLVKHFPVQLGILYVAIFFIVNYCTEGKAGFFALIFLSFVRYKSYLYRFQLEQIYSAFIIIIIIRIKDCFSLTPFYLCLLGEKVTCSELSWDDYFMQMHKISGILFSLIISLLFGIVSGSKRYYFNMVVKFSWCWVENCMTVTMVWQG